MLTPDEFEKKYNARIEAQARADGLTVGEYCERETRRNRDKEEATGTKEMAVYLENSGIPSRVWKTLESGISHTDAMAGVSSAKDIVVLSGEPGRGKSVAAMAWLLLGHGRWISAGALARGYAYDQTAFDSLAKAPRLVIDDLGTEYQDQKARYQATLSELLETRFANERPTLITTNLGPDDFKARYGDRLSSRIREDGVFIICGGNDLRRSNRDEAK